MAKMGSEVKKKRPPTNVLRAERKAKQPRIGIDPRKHEALIEEGLREYAPIWESLAGK